MSTCNACIQYLLIFHSHQGGFFALYNACQEGHERIVQLLIQAGANLDLQTNVSWSLYQRYKYRYV